MHYELLEYQRAWAAANVAEDDPYLYPDWEKAEDAGRELATAVSDHPMGGTLVDAARLGAIPVITTRLNIAGAMFEACDPGYRAIREDGMEFYFTTLGDDDLEGIVVTTYDPDTDVWSEALELGTAEELRAAITEWMGAVK